MKKRKVVLISVLVLMAGALVFALLGSSSKSLRGKEYYCDLGYRKCTLEFKKDKVVVEVSNYRPSDLSPSGMMLDSSKETIYDYEIVEKGVIICDGKEYTYYDFVKEIKSGRITPVDGLDFDKAFLGISKEWKLKK